MSLRVVIFVALIVAGACSDHEAAGLDRVKRVVCACKDANCAEVALKLLPQPQADAKSSHRAKQIAREMLDCLSKFYEDQRPSTDPDAPAEPPTVPTGPETSAPASARTP